MFLSHKQTKSTRLMAPRAQKGRKVCFYLVVHHAALVQHVGISAFRKLHRPVEVTQRPHHMPHGGAGLSSSLPAVGLQRVGLQRTRTQTILGETCQVTPQVLASKVLLVLGSLAQKACPKP